MGATVTEEQLSPQQIARVLGIRVADVETPLTAPDICQLKPLRRVDDAGADLGPMLLDTWWGYVGKARRERRAGTVRPTQAPEPDGHIGRTPYWWPESVARYVLNRPGRGVGGGQPSHRQRPVN